jgi:hypothetical protein
MPGKPLMLFAREERILLDGVLVVIVGELPQHILPRMRIVAPVPPVGIECVISALARLGF